MASLRRLSVHESSIYAARLTIRPLPKTQAAQHHYWSPQNGSSYGRSAIYHKDEYYTRVSERRCPRYTRTCGSWSRRYTRDSFKRCTKPASTENHFASSYDENSRTPAQMQRAMLRRKRALERDWQKLQKEQKSSSYNKQDVDEANLSASDKSGFLGTEKFLDMLKHDASAAYRYFQKELEKDSYKWLYDTKDFDSFWKKPDWWIKRRDVSDKDSLAGNRSFVSEASFEGSQTVQQAVSEDDFVIDPITLRKVPRVQEKADPIENPVSEITCRSKSQEVPVKRYGRPAAEYLDSFRKSKEPEEPLTTKLSGFAAQPWLVQNGFTEANSSATTLPVSTTEAKSEATSRIETSLDRMTRTERKLKTTQTPLDTSSKAAVVDKPVLEYPLEEKKTDDVDLLTASRIRATSGHVKPKSTTSSEVKEAQSKALNESWQNANKHYSEDLLGAYNNVLQQRRERIDREAVSREETAGLSAAEFKKVKQHYDDLRNEINETARILQQARRQILHDRLSMETEAMRDVFDNFDTRSRKQMIAITNTRESAQALCDSTANIENTTRLREKLAQVTRDADLVSQIRGIYEEQYGKITIDHKQPAPAHSNAKSPQPARPTSSASQSASTNDLRPKSFSGTKEDSKKDPDIRELLYKNIDSLALSEALRKRIKFALRGVPELDATIPRAALAASPAQALPIKTAPTTLKAAVHQSVPVTKQHKDKLPRTYEPEPCMYQILALDHETNKVVAAMTTSSIKHKASVPRSAASLLVHLDQPAKYFDHMMRLDKEGFRLISGSRTMLVYRSPPGRSMTPEEVAEHNMQQSAPRDMRPLREEPVFSGHLKPKERLLRSYQLAHRRARHAAREGSSLTGKSASAENQGDGRTDKKFYRGMVTQTGTIFLAVLVCYVIGNINARRENEKSDRLRREEAALQQARSQKNERWWF